MNSHLIRSLIVGAVCSLTPLLSYGNEATCDFSSPKDFLAERSMVFPVNGIRLDFHDNAGFTSQRPFLISRCTSEMASNCFRTAYFAFGVPKIPISQGDFWVIDNEVYLYEQNAEIKLFGRSETFAVISRSKGDELKSKFLVSEAKGLAAILLFNVDGRADYQGYLQGESCLPFQIRLKSGNNNREGLSPPKSKSTNKLHS